VILLEDILIDERIFEEKFACKLSACKGACCVEGDMGAPLTAEETLLLEQNLKPILRGLPEAGKQALREQGPWVQEAGFGAATPLVNGKECAYTVFENGLALCGIEKAWLAGKIAFRKPISCHLYPIREDVRGAFTVIRYDTWDICSPACQNGSERGIRVFEFLKEALTRRFGEDFYAQLETIAQQKPQN
jgi:hypothetical protein